MKQIKQSVRRLASSAAAVFLALLLSGCSWFFMPGPVIMTDEETEAQTAAPTEKDEPSGEVNESTPSETPSAESTVPSSEVSGSGSPEESSAVPSGETGTAPSGESSEEAVSASAESETPPEESPETPAFAVDYYRIPESLRAIGSDAVFVDACNVISACLAYRTSARLSSPPEEAGRVIYVADTLCPLLKAFTDVSEDSCENGELRWNFYVDKVEFAIVRAEFETQVAEYIEPVLDPVYTETERALLLYHAYTKPATYNYEIISGAFKTRTEAEKHRIHSAYAGIMDHTGVCHDLAGGMTFLFIQGGFNAGRVSVYNKDEHSWTLIELDGRYTFCDATWDVGGSFSFFGNSAEERKVKAGGSYPLKDMNIFDFNAPSHFDIVNPGFADVQNFSRRIGNGTLLSLSVDTLVTPHCLTFTAPSGLRIIIESP